MKRFRVIICGGRDYQDGDAVRDAIMDLMKEHGSDRLVIVQGGATGADWHARRWARFFRICTETFEASWALHGKAAGPARNQRMIDAGADLLIAFPGGRGTEDCIRRAEKAGIPVRRIAEAAE